jgi:tetratricopeptide (TPR) repeat protein
VPAAPGAAPAGETSARSAARRGFAWGILSAAALAGLAVWVSGAARPRGQGGSLTGTPQRPGAAEAPAPPPAAAPESDQELAGLRAAVAAHPDDLDARLELAQAYLGRRDMMQVWEQTQAVLERSPGHPRALSYQALVRLAMGQADEAERMLKQAMAAAPNLLEPRLHLSLVYARTGRMAAADAVLDEAKRRFPRDAEALERLRQEMKAQAAGQGGPGEPPAPGEQPAAEAEPPPPAAAEGPHVSGQIELDAAGAAPPGAIVFLIARASGQNEGPPLAVKRLPAAFPLRFTLGREDSMMGQELPARLRVEARLDADGDPLTRSAQDPSARLDDVRLGQDRLVLRLR